MQSASKAEQQSPISRPQSLIAILAYKDIPSDLLEVIPDMCFVVNDGGLILNLNKLAATVLGRNRSDLVNTPLQSFVSASWREQFLSSLRGCADGKIRTQREVPFMLTSGSFVTTDLFFSRFGSGNGHEGIYFIIARDVSVEKEKELDLLRFYNIAHYTVNPIEITGPDGKITYVNPAFEKSSGYSKEELIGKNPNVFGSGKYPKSFWEKMWKTITSGEVWTGEIENRRKNGDPFHTQLLISPIVDSLGKIIGFFAVHRDITEQKMLEQQLIHAQKMESIGLLAAGIAHEVGNPLTSISSVVQVIQRETNDKFVQEKLELIRSQVTRISKIIRDLVDFSRRSSYEVQLTDINKNIRDAVEIVRVGAKAKQVSFQVNLHHSLPLLTLVPDQIEQVFINILINAVDAIHERAHHALENNQPHPPKEISVSSVLTESHVKVSIKDTGKGISDDALPKIFEPFYTTKKVGEGTGLGLWVTYGIIKSFQGTIDVQSVVGQGTTFIIALPLHREI